ncbi:MAG: hypothetical protein IKH02_03440 [Prevotella sp.]|nr:hypothetical protein [Prevotella sp.]MBR3088052.1 hypothetical protein [Prevotella sp.]
MKKQILITALLLMSAAWLHAQENKHAQAMRTAFVETMYGKFPKSIDVKLKSMNEDSVAVAWGEWGCLDGGGLVPREKIHVVDLSKSKSDVVASIGPLYIDGHRFSFNQVPDDPTLPLRPILDAFDKQSPFANSYYSYTAGDEQAVFPGVKIAWGEQGQTFPLQLYPSMNTRIISFKDDDGFRSTYLLTWTDTELTDGDTKHKYYMVEGIIYEFHCPKIDNTPQMKSYDPDEYLNRTNTGLGVAHNLVRGLQKSNPERAKTLETDTMMEKGYGYIFQEMVAKLYGSSEIPNVYTSFDALLAKVQRMWELSRTADMTELEAILHTLNKEVGNYPFLLSQGQIEKLCGLIDALEATVPPGQRQQVESARKNINAKRNLTAEIDNLNEQDQDYLNRNFWKLSHDNAGTQFTACGEHYSGDERKGYLNVSGDARKGFEAETTLKNLRPGRYRVSAVVRASEAEHSNVFIFAKTGNGNLCTKEIPAMGNTGGNVWFSALCRFERRAGNGDFVTALDIDKTAANGGQGFGWSRIWLDEVTVCDDDTLTYGVSTRQEITHSEQINSSWFSACDFIVERIGD